MSNGGGCVAGESEASDASGTTDAVSESMSVDVTFIRIAPHANERRAHRARLVRLRY